MIMCYGKEVKDIEVVRTKYGERCLVMYGTTGKQHDVSCESISWVSPDWYNKD